MKLERESPDEQGGEQGGDAIRLLVDEFEDGAEFVADGEFTVDIEQAGDKLEQYQLAESAMWVLLALEGGLALGPRRVLVGGPLDGLDLVFEGVELADAEDLNARRVGAKLGSDTRAKALELVGYAARAAARSRGHGRVYASPRGLCVEVRGGPCKRERALTKTHCWAASSPVLVEFQPASFGPAHRLDPSLGRVPFVHDGRELGVAGYAERRSEGGLYLTRHGVVYEQLDLPRAAIGAPCIVVDAALPRDLSLTKFIRQAEFEALEQAARAFCLELEDATATARAEAQKLPSRPSRSAPFADTEVESSSGMLAVVLLLIVLGLTFLLVFA